MNHKFILTLLAALTLTACQNAPIPVEAGKVSQVSPGPEQVNPITDLTVQHGAMLNEQQMGDIRSGAVQSITIVKAGQAQSLAWQRLVDTDGQVKVQIKTVTGHQVRTWTADLEYLLRQLQLYLVNDVSQPLSVFVTGK